MLTAVLVVGTAAVAPRVADSTAGAPAWSPDGKRIAYSATGEAGHLSDVYVADLDGTRRVNVTRMGTATDYGEPAWSRDGRQLAYVATIRPGFENAIFGYIVAAGDGSAAHQVGSSPTVATPTFSANGRYLAFDGFESVDVATTDGTAQRQVAGAAGYPVFSPESDRLAFALADRTDQGHVYTANPDGSGRHRLTSARGFEYPLRWSRGGRFLLFHTDREIFQGNTRRPDAVYAMRFDGRGQHRVGYGREGDFSPGAARVVYAGAGGGLWTARLDGSGRKQLVQGIVHEPRWSPDGRWIAYALSVDDASRIELIHPDGSGRMNFAP
jgi:TolB protein